MPAWRDAGPDTRTAVCVEILTRHPRARLRAGQRRAVHHRPGVRDGVPGRRPARAGPGARGGRVRVRRDEPPPGHRRLGEAGGQGRPAADEQDVPRGPAWHRRWSSAATRSRPGTPTRACSPSLATGNAVVVKPHPRAVLPLAITVEVRPRGAGRGRLRPEPGAAGRRGAPARRLASTLALRPEVKIVDFTGSTRVRRVAGAERPPGGRVHREGRRQHGRRRLHRRLRRHVPQHRLLAVALQRPDVHHAAEHPGAARTASRPRPGHSQLRRGRRRHRRRGGEADRRRRPRGRADRRASSTRAWSAGSRPRVRTATSCWTRARSSTRRSRTPWCARR